MMRLLCLPICLLALAAPTWAQQPAPLASGLKNPESVAVGGDGRVYVTSIGDFDRDGDGAVLVLDKGKAAPFVAGLDDPKGIVAFQKWLFVADRDRVWKIDLKGQKSVYVAAKDFPTQPVAFNDVTADPETGTLFVSDSGTKENKGGAVYRIPPKGKITLVTDQTRWPELVRPNGLLLDGQNHLLLLDSGTGQLHRLHLATGKKDLVAEGLGHGDGLAWDRFGRLFISDFKGGKVHVIARPGAAPELVASDFQSAADICLAPDNRHILVPDMKAGIVRAIPAAVPSAPVDDSPLPIETTLAFPKLKLPGWKSEDDKGLIVPARPIVLTHAGDGSNRIFLALQHGNIYTIDPKTGTGDIFMGWQPKVFYSDKENEQGLLGLAFHPRFKQNGEFFLFYTPKKDKTVNVLSRFRVHKSHPHWGNVDSEEVLLRIKRPFWNHDGGTICFGPDGFLYVALGDGGAANDPMNNGQNLKSLLGKILRIDVDRKDDGKAYAIPQDNPFINRQDAIPETWAWGLRNVWRMSFDRKTGQLWAADVGQNLYEEINLITKGGNYGWKLREALHPFGSAGIAQRSDLIDPIWEYHHDVGKSITGGPVYRGKKLPELEGHYLYADYVSAKIWALRYDEEKKRVVANRPLRDRNLPILSFGEDEQGEPYLLTTSRTDAGGIWKLVRTDAKN